MRFALRAWLMSCVLSGLFGINARAAEPKPIPFVIQMTIGDSDAQRRAFMQIAKVLEDIGPNKVRIEVVAYEGGIASLLADNNDTVTLLAALAREGVQFKPAASACVDTGTRMPISRWRSSSSPPTRRR